LLYNAFRFADFWVFESRRRCLRCNLHKLGISGRSHLRVTRVLKIHAKKGLGGFFSNIHVN
jgi:hypothetical protein